jgi:hypothetical protein
LTEKKKLVGYFFVVRRQPYYKMSVISNMSEDAFTMAMSRGGNSLREAMARCFSVSAEPETRTMAYQIYKSIWLKEPHKFRVISGIHQNGMFDPLHFSVEVEVAEGWCNRLHFNGYFRDYFRVVNVTASTMDRGNKITETVVAFQQLSPSAPVFEPL